jgi:hypothetical protein
MRPRIHFGHSGARPARDHLRIRTESLLPHEARLHIEMAKAAKSAELRHEHAAHFATDLRAWNFHRKRARQLRATLAACLRTARAAIIAA